MTTQDKLADEALNLDDFEPPKPLPPSRVEQALVLLLRGHTVGFNSPQLQHDMKSFLADDGVERLVAPNRETTDGIRLG